MGLTQRLNASDFCNVGVYEFWEEDSGGHGGDDFLGSKTINWKGLPYSGYVHLNFAHGGIMVDRD